MGGGDFHCASPLTLQAAGLLLQKGIAHRPTGFLYAQGTFGGHAAHRLPPNGKRHSPRRAQAADKHLVPLRLVPPQAVIQMGRRHQPQPHFLFFLQKKTEQRHGIGAARQGNQHRVSGSQHGLPGGGRLCFFT